MRLLELGAHRSWLLSMVCTRSSKVGKACATVFHNGSTTNSMKLSSSCGFGACDYRYRGSRLQP